MERGWEVICRNKKTISRSLMQKHISCRDMEEKSNKFKLYIMLVGVNESQGCVLVSHFLIYKCIYSIEHPVGRRVNEKRSKQMGKKIVCKIVEKA